VASPRRGQGGGTVAPNPLQTRFSDSCKSGEKYEGGDEGRGND